MTDVFISYTKDDRAVAQRVAAWLEGEGLSVWWDTSLLVGDSWSEVIRAELRNARCVLVLWSKSSWSSRWVQAEAHTGFERNCLVSVLLEDLTLEAPFNTIQAIPFEGDRTNLLAGIRKKLGATLGEPVTAKPTRKQLRLSRRTLVGVGAGTLALGTLTAGAFVARPYIPRWFPHAIVTAEGQASGLGGLRVLRTLPAQPALRAHFALNGMRLYSIGTTTGQLWDVSTGRLVAHWPLASAHDGHAALSPDRSRLVYPSSNDTAVIRDVSSGDEIAVCGGHTANVTTASFDATGSIVVTTSDDRSVRLWHAASGEQIKVLRSRWGVDGNADVYPIHAEFAPDGLSVAVGLMYGELLVLNTATGEEIASTWRQGAFSSAAFSPDGSRILSTWSNYALPGEAGVDEYTTVLANIATGQQTTFTYSQPSDATHQSFSPTGDTLVIGFEDAARVFSVASGQVMATLNPHNDGIISAGFSDQGDFIGTSYWSGEARIWDPETASLLATLRGHTGNVLWVAMSHGLIATSSSDNTIRIWGTEA